MKKWEELPENMKNEQVRYYYDILANKQFSLALKRIFDIVISAIMLVLLSPVFVALALAVKIDSKGPVFYRQERITSYGKVFYIHKFRTMADNADKNGSLVTVKNDSRVTRVGKFIRKYKIDEIGQLIDVFVGDMTFVGTRPEVRKYVDAYAPIMLATLLLPAGITSEASILYKDEDELLSSAENVDSVYINNILQSKMYYNLKSIEKFNFFSDILTMFKTVFAVIGKKYESDPQGEAEFAERINKEYAESHKEL